MAKVIIDGQEVDIGDRRMNGVQAARLAGVEIPHYCWHPGLSVVASCRMCLVETGTKNAETGAVQMLPKLVPACQTPASNNTVFVTNSPKVQTARAMVEEYLLMDHPIDCPICDKAGECTLQDYHFKYGQKERRFDLKPYTTPTRDLGPTVKLFIKRCVMCTRCVRFTREQVGSSELMVVHRGNAEEIDVFPGKPLANKLSGNVVDLCPVGALGDKDFMYQQRVWYMKRHDGICGGCASGCNIHVDENQDHVYRVRPRENMAVNTYWMCDEGRYGFKYVNSEERFQGPWRKDGEAFVAMEWSQLFLRLEDRLAKETGRFGVVVSPFATVEEAYLLSKLAKKIDPEAVLALGPVPVAGEDETFKGGFVIRAEKAPNKRGVEPVLAHFGGVVSFEDFVAKADKGEFAKVWVAGGYPKSWIDAETSAKLAKAKLLVVQDLFASDLAAKAEFVLPSTTYVEKDGSFVNVQNRLQALRWAVRSPGAVRSEGGVYQALLGVKGLFKSAQVLAEVAREIPFFSAALGVDVPPLGLDLLTNQLAGQPAAAATV